MYMCISSGEQGAGMSRRDERIRWENFWTTVICIGGAVFFVVAFMFVELEGEGHRPENPSEKAGRPSVLQMLIQRVSMDKRNEDLPEIVDRNIRLDRVESDLDGLITYHITFLNHTAHEVRQMRFDRTRFDLIKGRFCTQPELIDYLKRGWRFRAVSRDETGETFRDVTITQASCNAVDT